MSKKKEKKKTDLVVLVLDLVIVAMLFWVIYVGISMAFYMKVAKEFSSFSQDANMMSYELETNDYASFIRGNYMNELTDNTKSKSYQALASYVEAKSMYKVYAFKGYDDKAKAEQDIMDESRAKMGTLTVYADKVDKMFE